MSGRRVLDSWLEGCHVHRASADLKLAIGELVANAVHHSRGSTRLLGARPPDRVHVAVHTTATGHPAIGPIVTTGTQRRG